MRRVARVLIQQGDCVLAVLHRGDPRRIALPGGRIDPGESPEHAAVRELYEETGLRATWLEPLCLVSLPKRKTFIWRGGAEGQLRGSSEGPALWAPPIDFLRGDYAHEYAQIFEVAGI